MSKLYQVILQSDEFPQQPVVTLVYANDCDQAGQRILTRFPGASNIISTKEVDPNKDIIFKVETTLTRVRVRIKECNDPGFWYYCKCGEEYDGLLIINNSNSYAYKRVVTDLIDVKTNKPQLGGIHMEHCELIHIETYY